MIFSYRFQGIPCQVEVTCYQKAEEYRPFNPNIGNEAPPEPEIFEFRLLDRKGYSATWLERKMTPAIERDIHRAFLSHVEELNQKEP
jgi:hypothetical protein